MYRICRWYFFPYFCCSYFFHFTYVVPLSILNKHTRMAQTTATEPSSSSAPHVSSAFPVIGIASRFPSRRPSWRHKDSSEDTPSTVESDNAAYIAPGIPVSSLLQGSISLPPAEGDACTRISGRAEPIPNSNAQRSASLASATSGVTDASGLQEVMPWAQDDGTHTARAGVEGGDADHPASIISPPLRVIVNRRRQKLKQGQENHVPTDQLGSRPLLAPLKPQYSPPKRRPTPPGVPSFESAQRTLESRLALRRFDVGQPRSNFGTVRTSSSGVGNGTFSSLSL